MSQLVNAFHLGAMFVSSNNGGTSVVAIDRFELEAITLQNWDDQVQVDRHNEPVVEVPGVALPRHLRVNGRPLGSYPEPAFREVWAGSPATWK